MESEMEVRQPRESLDALFEGLQGVSEFMSVKESVRSLAKQMGGQIDSYEQEGGFFEVRIGSVTGWGSNALYSRRFLLATDAKMAAE